MPRKSSPVCRILLLFRCMLRPAVCSEKFTQTGTARQVLHGMELLGKCCRVQDSWSHVGDSSRVMICQKREPGCGTRPVPSANAAQLKGGGEGWERMGNGHEGEWGHLRHEIGLISSIQRVQNQQPGSRQVSGMGAGPQRRHPSRDLAGLAVGRYA